MKQIFDLLIQYWKLILGLVFFIVGFFIALLKKKPISDILTDIYYYCVLAIIDTELFSKYEKIDSEVKLARAVEYVINKLKTKYPTLDVNRYVKAIIKVIEDLLSTPQKKGV